MFLFMVGGEVVKLVEVFVVVEVVDAVGCVRCLTALRFSLCDNKA